MSAPHRRVGLGGQGDFPLSPHEQRPVFNKLRRILQGLLRVPDPLPLALIYQPQLPYLLVLFH